MYDNMVNSNSMSDAQFEALLIKLLELLRYRAAKTQSASVSACAEMPVMLTVKEASKKYSISEYTLRKLVAQKKIIGIRTGVGENGKILINVASLEAYLNGVAV